MTSETVNVIEVFDSAYDAAARARLDALEAVTVTGGGLATGGGDLTANRVITVPKATGEEADLGVDDTKAITPLALATPIATLLTVIETEEIARGDGDATAAANLAAHLADLDNPHEVTANQLTLGFDVEDVTAHLADLDNPHETTADQVGLGLVDNVPDAAKPISSLMQDALDVISDSLDTHLQNTDNPHQVTASQIDLGLVDNVADIDKPISTAQQSAISAVQASSDSVLDSINTHLSDTSNPHQVTATQVGLGSVDDVADIDKPISTAQQSAISAVQAASDSVLDSVNTHLADTSNPHQVTATQVGLGSAEDTADIDKPVSTAQQAAINAVQASTDIVSDSINTHLSDTSNPHQVTAEQVGLGLASNTADANKPVSTATATAIGVVQTASNLVATNLATHTALTNNPHSTTKAQVGLGSADNTTDAAKPVSTATQTALNVVQASSDSVASDLADHVADVDNPHETTATQLGLDLVDNVADIDKPVSTAQQAAINVVQAASDVVADSINTHLSDTSNPHQVTALQVGLDLASNTADADKPVSTATQTALNLKAPLASPTFTGTVAVPNLAPGTNNTQSANSAFVTAADVVVSAAISTHAALTNNPHSTTKAQVGLSSADNTSDAAKPISTATQTVLDLKAALISPAFTSVPTAPTAAPGTDSDQIATTAYALGEATAVADDLATHVADTNNPHVVTATDVGLGSVDDTADIDKPVSTDQAVAIASVQSDTDDAQADADAAQADATQALADAAPVPSLVERAQERPGDAWALFGTAAIGEQDAIDTVDQDWVTSTAAGKALRITADIAADPRIIAPLGAYAVETGVDYEIRYKVKRQTDPLDPLNDSVTCGIRWLDYAKAGISGGAGTVAVDDIALEVADGVQQRIARISSIGGDTSSNAPPAGAIYFRPFIALYGADHVTDIIAIDVRSSVESSLIVGEGFILRKLSGNPAAGPGAGLVRLYAIEGASGKATLKVQAGTSSESFDLMVDFGSGF